jgi:hypothetical protein
MDTTSDQQESEFLGFTTPHYHFKPYESIDWYIGDQVMEREPKTPSEWFAYHFKESRKYGPAILERHVPCKDGFERVIPLEINENFMASMLGSSKCNRVIFYRPEQRFYWYNLKEDQYEVVTEEDIKAILSAQIFKAAQEVNSLVDIEALLKFRRDEVLDLVVRRAKSLLARDKDFFAAGSGNRRCATVDLQEAATRFLTESMEEAEDSYVTVKETFEAYTGYAKAREYPLIPRTCFTQVLNKTMQSVFNRSLRNDLLRLGADQARGWKGVRFKEVAV